MCGDPLLGDHIGFDVLMSYLLSRLLLKAMFVLLLDWETYPKKGQEVCQAHSPLNNFSG